MTVCSASDVIITKARIIVTLSRKNVARAINGRETRFSRYA